MILSLFRKRRPAIDVASALAAASALLQQGRYADANAGFEAVVSFDPGNADALLGRGNARFALGRAVEALADFERALAQAPHYAGAAYNCGFVLRSFGRRDEAIAALDAALAIRPDYADALNLRGVALTERQRFDEALVAFERLRAIAPGYPDVLGNVAYTSGLVGRWDVRDSVTSSIELGLRQGKRVASPLAVVALFDDPELQLAAARILGQQALPPQRLWQGEGYLHPKIRLAYLSANFHAHAVAYLMAGVLEAHDRKRFEVTGISFGPPDAGPMRSRIVAALDQFIDARGKSDDEVAHLIRAMEVDIAVDLMGHTGDSRPGILAWRPAPVQVNYLGYPGTMGAGYIDYILADRFVIPPDARACYAEQVVYLPDVFQANDRNRPGAGASPSRSSLGLPDEAFVFCCFNNAYKIAPPVFDVWMRLLARVDDAVLWLFAANASFEVNVREAATLRGVAPSRIVFARKASYADYLAQYGAADLFLDTLPFNGGTTASDALWAGLPVLTCAGRAFAARMAGSLLLAAGLPELVTHSIEAYEASALALARDRATLREYKARLSRHRMDTALFDTDRFTRNLEAAYATMRDIAQSGSPPRSFAAGA